MDTVDRRHWLSTAEQGTVKRTTVSTIEIWAEALNGPPDKLDRYAAKEIRDIMAQLSEWRRMGADKRERSIYGRQRVWRRTDP